jgi:hypothetical protein
MVLTAVDMLSKTLVAVDGPATNVVARDTTRLVGHCRMTIGGDLSPKASPCEYSAAPVVFDV